MADHNQPLHIAKVQHVQTRDGNAKARRVNGASKGLAATSNAGEVNLGDSHGSWPTGCCSRQAAVVILLLCCGIVAWMNFEVINFKMTIAVPVREASSKGVESRMSNPVGVSESLGKEESSIDGVESIRATKGDLGDGGLKQRKVWKRYAPMANYSLPENKDTWEYNLAVTNKLIETQSFPPRTVNRYVGAGAWVKPNKSIADSLLLNDDGEAWVPYDCEGEDWCKDGVKKMDHLFACSEMQRLGLSRILVLGESLERHLFQALSIIFSGDYVAGSLKKDTPANKVEMCSGDMQFSERSCRQFASHSTTTCAGKLRMHMKEAYNVRYASYGLDAAREYASQQSDLLIAGVGLHDNLGSPLGVINLYLKFLLKSLRKARAKSTFVWFSVHAVNSKQQPKYRGRQKLEILYEYNEAVEAACEQQRVDYINSMLLTMGQLSYDGVHFESKINLIRGTLFLWQFFRNNATKPLAI